jgi:ABC-type antimicrobial peptide transport system permease subunit
MIGDVEEKTYEFGMLRALGFGKVMLVVLLTF